MNKYTFIFLLLVLISLSSCENVTEGKLLEVRKSTKFDETKQKKGFDSNIKRERKDGIEYGVITLENSEKVKYWFQSHHIGEDGIGGTLFELPNGKLKFIKGYFCCEVQLPKKGNFKNSKEFIAEMEKVDGIHP
ncbi:hypothetical protein J8J42_02140 [Chryseobacterium sp. cx-311]|uniref:hypothetical protein n=1 Tax=Marnyiella aurantia TaxID=2758037 RepID=UPI001AE67DC6|nr:hypothetical protein [Marnyiella aurantia]MBP0611843.1 hypothetical protein [Marnyiella aurantia]